MADRIIETIEEAFIIPNILGWWSTIAGAYTSLGFCDQISDKERIEEYDYIAQQLNKFISSKHKQIMNTTDVNQILKNAKFVFDHAPFEVRDRKFLVYLALRDEWLNGLISLIESVIEEEEEDEWN